VNDARDAWHVVDRVFSDALDVDPERRADFVRERLEGDTALIARVMALLEAADDERLEDELDARNDLETVLAQAIQSELRDTDTAPATDADALADPLIGATLDKYRISRALGHGGMGSVYLADRIEGFEHRVAIKTLKRGFDTREVVQRFLAERQILAQLDHPNIARLFDGGATPDGRPYFVMEFVEGRPITEYADTARLDIPGRLGLIRTIARALQHAHEHLVIHRDLKPSNVLVTDAGEVKLLDFGIARLLSSEAGEPAPRTATSFRVFTPEYAAPEQIARRPATTRTDVYQLGALAYELLSGVRPFPQDLVGIDLERAVLESDPSLASKAVLRAPSEAALNRGCATPGDLAQQLAGDLDVILGKALTKEVDRRYASIEALAEDLGRHSSGMPILARPATVRYRLSRFTKRNRWFIPATAAVVAALGLFVQTSVRHNRALTAERNLARAEAARAEAVTEFVTGLIQSPNPWAGGQRADVTVLDVLDDGAQRIEDEFAGQPRLQARLFQNLGASYYGLERLDEAEEFQTRAVELWREVAGSESIDTWSAMASLANTLTSTKGPDSALAVLEPLQERLDPATTDEELVLQAEVFESLATAQRALSDFDSAFVLYERAHQSLATLETPRPILVGGVLREHSRALGIADRPDDALDLALRAVSILESALPRDHIELAAARRQLGSALSLPASGRQEEALEEFERVLAIYARRLPSDDPNVLDVRYDKAYALLNLGRLAEAEAEYRALVTLYEGQENGAQSHADALQNLGATLKRQGRLDEAVDYSLQAHRVYKRELGEHYLTAYPLLTVAEVELNRGRYLAGRDLATEAYDLLRITLPTGHAATWVARCRRGWGRWHTGMTEQGLVDMELASAALDASSYGAEHPYPVECRRALAEARAKSPA